MEPPFDRLLRFSAPDGSIHYGEAAEVADTESLIGKTVPTYEGPSPWDSQFRKTGISKQVKQILCPLPEVPYFHCVGLNYRRHIEETGSKLPQTPALFSKTPDSLAAPFEDIVVHQEAPWMDYEGELCAVIGKTALNLGKDENPLDYVLGYAVGNDVTSRYWQAAERSSAQAGYSKSFDKFCPLGPVIASSKAVADATNLRLTTKVNGEIRQDARTDDLLFSVAAIIRFVSRGHTLRPGTVIMTGTPSGVGAARSPPVWLKDGDVVEIGIEKIGVIRNRFVIPQDQSFPCI